MANNKEELKGWDKVVAWYASKAYAVNIVYSVGASVVIIGALFKILHWPGASIVLMCGMFTESFLFILGIFEKPHAAYHWENVYPQLIGDEVKEVLGGAGGAIEGEKKEKAEVPAIQEEDLKALKEGINALGKTAQQLSTLGTVAESTAKLNERMAAAGEAADRLATSADGATEGLVASQKNFADGLVASQKNFAEGLVATEKAFADGLAASQTAIVDATNASVEKVQALGATYQSVAAGMDAVVRQTEAYGKGIEAVNAQIGSLNSVYELQLKSIKAQADAFDAQTAKINHVGEVIEDINTDAQKLNDATKNALRAQVAYEEASVKLAQQVADLNKVYGNMLNALA